MHATENETPTKETRSTKDEQPGMNSPVASVCDDVASPCQPAGSF